MGDEPGPAGRERLWGGGGGGAGPEPGGGGAAAGLLWRPTRGGGGGGDPPPSTWTVAEAWADALTPGRGGRAAAATAGAARGRGRLTVVEPSLASPRLGAAAILRPGTQEAWERSLRSPSSRARGGAERSGASPRPARAVDGESWAEGNWAREAAPPPPPLTVPGRRLRGKKPRPWASPPPTGPLLCGGARSGGERRSRTVEPEARHPAAATFPTRGPHSPRAPRRCRPWSKEEAAWEEEDGGGQERWQHRGCFPERYVRGSLGGESGGCEIRDPGVPAPRAVILSCVLRAGLGPRGCGRSMAGKGTRLQARRLRVRPGKGSDRLARGGAMAAQRAEAQGGLRGARRRLGLAPTSVFSMVAQWVRSGLRWWKVSDR